MVPSRLVREGIVNIRTSKAGGFHSLPFVGSVVEQENGEKADHHPEHRAENSDPE